MYAITTFGPGTKKTYRSLKEAISAASRLPDSTLVRVYECDSEQLARSADISVIRDGERVVWTNR